MGLFSILERSMTPLLFSYSCYQVSVCKETPLTVLPRWCSGKGLACQCRRRGFNPWVQKVPWSRKWQPAPVFLPGKSHGQRSLAAAVHEITKSQTQLERTHTHTHTHTHTQISLKSSFYPCCFYLNQTHLDYCISLPFNVFFILPPA